MTMGPTSMNASGISAASGAGLAIPGIHPPPALRTAQPQAIARTCRASLLAPALPPRPAPPSAATARQASIPDPQATSQRPQVSHHLLSDPPRPWISLWHRAVIDHHGSHMDLLTAAHRILKDYPAIGEDTARSESRDIVSNSDELDRLRKHWKYDIFRFLLEASEHAHGKGQCPYRGFQPHPAHLGA